ncbi:ATP-binding protein [Sphingobacterium siyangense]|uniref:Histidine kinase/DNA gyrase B/HSP90-like ATPase n=1 Tax=Sphingobacterium siyangense TaxID=459529 RepID=A0A562MAK4_9SPHI|nr:ATP-binding protein [Sphingobacterium siyangense]TWI16591.1 histidine kinase/DNA gyrase B/HSP90-like ATPase [Sphingobacterium siyangense]
MSDKKNEPLKWRFDISTFRLIGRDLITDRVTALFELIKNCYDANAKRVDLIFENLGSPNGCIKIIDDGFGMSLSDIRNKWMVIGTSNKRQNKVSPAPFNRRNVGEKGIGRFAVDKLGDDLIIITKTEKDPQWLSVNINWESYHKKFIDGNQNKEQLVAHNKVSAPPSNQLLLFTDVETEFDYLDTYSSEKLNGTTLIISNIRDEWTKKDLQKLENEIKKIVSPYHLLNPEFKVFLTAKQFGYDNLEIKAKQVDFATYETTIDYGDNYQESLFFDESSHEIKKKNLPIQSFGVIRMTLYYFDDAARRNYTKIYGKNNNPFDGVKIYRDGIITTPFAEAEIHADKKRDILGIDKRVWQNIFDRISTREIIGILEITSENNPRIIDATNRQDFLDNIEYRDLKDFIIIQLTALEGYKKHLRSLKKLNSQPVLDKAKGDLDELTKVVQQVAIDNPALKNQLQPIIEVATKTSKSVKSVIKQQKDTEEEFLRKENMYLSVMSLQEYAVHITHAVRTSLGKIQRKAKFFFDYYPDTDEEEFFLLYSKEIYEEMMILNKVIEFMLSYSQSNLSFREVNIYDSLSKIFQTFSDILEVNKIKYQIDAPNNLILNTQEHFIIDIFQNLLSNSIKALRDTDKKIIKCSVSVNKQLLTSRSLTKPTI